MTTEPSRSIDHAVPFVDARCATRLTCKESMPHLTLATAETISEAALAKAAERSLKPRVVAVLDTRGCPKVLAAQGGVSPMRSQIAFAKVYGAVLTRGSSCEQRRPDHRCDMGTDLAEIVDMLFERDVSDEDVHCVHRAA